MEKEKGHEETECKSGAGRWWHRAGTAKAHYGNTSAAGGRGGLSKFPGASGGLVHDSSQKTAEIWEI